MSERAPSAADFESILKNFEYSMQGYRLFLDQLHGPLKDSYEEELPTRTKQIVESLEAKDRESLVEAFRVLAARTTSVAAGESTGEDEANGSVKSGNRTIELSGSSARAFMAITRHIRRNRWTGPAAQLERLYRSVIIGLVGQFEILIADIAHQYFRRAPGALNAEEKILSLSDLQQFGSMDVALDYLVDREIDKLLARSAEDWARFFEKRMKMQLRAMAWDWETFKEVIQRRHIIVHADGRISRRYLENVARALVKKYFGEGKVGQATMLDREYVEEALDHFEILGTLLCCTAWLKLDKAKESLHHFEETLLEWVYDRLCKGRWKMALAMAREGENNDELSLATQVVCRLNVWLCLKRMDRFDEIGKCVGEFDDSAYEPRFRLVRLAILDRQDEFLNLLEACEGAGLDRQAWQEWPVFSEMRENARYVELAERFAPETTSDVANEVVGKPPEGERSEA